MEKANNVLRTVLSGIDFTKPVKYADECVPCKLCGEPWCTECNEHYAECSCPGPMSEPEEP